MDTPAFTPAGRGLVGRMDPTFGGRATVWGCILLPSQRALMQTEPLGSAAVREGLLEEGTYIEDLSGRPSESPSATLPSPSPHTEQVAPCSGGLLLPRRPGVSSNTLFLGAATVLSA